MSGQESTPGLGCAEDSSLDTPTLCMKHVCFPLLPPHPSPCTMNCYPAVSRQFLPQFICLAPNPSSSLPPAHPQRFPYPSRALTKPCSETGMCNPDPSAPGLHQGMDPTGQIKDEQRGVSFSCLLSTPGACASSGSFSANFLGSRRAESGKDWMGCRHPFTFQGKKLI